MAEYDRIQKKQESRAIANNESMRESIQEPKHLARMLEKLYSQQKVEFVDGRNESTIQKKIIGKINVDTTSRFKSNFAPMQKKSQTIQLWFNSIDNVPANYKPTSNQFYDGEILAIANWIQNKNGNSTAIRNKIENVNVIPVGYEEIPYQWNIAYHTDLAYHSHGEVATPHTHISTNVEGVGNTDYSIPNKQIGITNGPNLGPVFTPWLELVYLMNENRLHPNTKEKLIALIQSWTNQNADKRFKPQEDSENDDVSLDLDLLF